uniref:Fungal lipase-type domain-containing protein n=1 Tax=Kalanchoe fedtschenkoi TaxID=63787 RepID=A0A7N0TUV7_KALFE
MEGIRLQSGVPGIAPGMGGSEGNRTAIPSQVAASGSRSGQRAWQNLSSRFLSRNPLEFLWPGGGNRCKGVAVDDAVVGEGKKGGGGEEMEMEMEGGRGGGSWMESILHDRWAVQVMEDGGVELEGCSACEVDNDNDEKNEAEAEADDEKLEFDSNSFSRFLRRVNLSDAKMFAQLSYLSMLAYCIPKIKAKKLVNNRGLTFVTSSLEKRELLSVAEKDQVTSSSTRVQESSEKVGVQGNDHSSSGYFINAAAAYDIAASAAAYLHSQTKSILPFTSSNDEETKSVNHDDNSADDDIKHASLKATADSVNSVISSGEGVKQSVADDLNSAASSPCEWFICDDNQTATRYFVIQGSESLASWQANLLFEPVQFEELDILVHRGIYEAAKGIYEQMLPEIRSHMKSRGERATLRFTGHSLGGSLAMLVNLMLLIRHEVPESCLLPVVTFGAPFIMCGGNKLLTELGLPKNHIQALILHRDVVPRAFSADLPSRAVDLLKAVNGNFRNHPCLSNQNIMYDPMGQLLILQPDPRFSPPHSLLPSGSGLYLLTPPESDSPCGKKSLRSAQLVFLNSPHPLEILSDRAAYGAEGSIIRDHDMRSYVKAIRVVIHHELNQINKARTEQRNKDRWPLVSPRGGGQPTSAANFFQQHEQLNFAGALHTGKESLKRFSRLVASQHMQMLVLLVVPARLFLLEAYNTLSFS